MRRGGISQVVKLVNIAEYDKSDERVNEAEIGSEAQLTTSATSTPTDPNGADCASLVSISPLGRQEDLRSDTIKSYSSLAAAASFVGDGMDSINDGLRSILGVKLVTVGCDGVVAGVLGSIEKDSNFAIIEAEPGRVFRISRALLYTAS